MKSERLKKLEAELTDLEQWMKLGLVPKKELERHREEIVSLKSRINEEKERLAFLKESGEMEEYTAPRRSPAKTVYPETPSMSDVEFNNESTEAAIEMDTETAELESTEEERDERTATASSPAEEEPEDEEEDEEDPFSDRNRWRRGGIIDPDATEW